MGYAFCTGRCFSCGQIFNFNPVRVPSIRYPHPTSDRQPICRSCIEIANPKRIKNGLPPVEIHPDAYSFCEESEL